MESQCTQLPEPPPEVIEIDIPQCNICTWLATVPKQSPIWCQECFELKKAELKDKVRPQCTLCKAKESDYGLRWCNAYFDKVLTKHDKLINKGECSSSKNS